MKSEYNFKELTLYISVWGWNLLSFILLIASIILIALPRTLFSLVFGVAFFFAFVMSEFMMLKRRKEFDG